MRDTLLPFLVKTAEDREKMLLKHNFERLCVDAAKHARELVEAPDLAVPVGNLAREAAA